MGIRRVVSGQDAAGKSIIVSDGIVEAVGAMLPVVPVWGTDAPPHFPLDGTHPGYTNLFPGPGGCRFLVMTILPDKEVAALSPPPSAGRSALGAGSARYMEPDAPGMHMTDTIDFEVVLSGEATQEFDDGAIVHLRAGDTFVQNGTRHRWSNRGDVPAIVAVFLFGGHPRERAGDA